jgi:hypothetical protein
MAELKSRQLRDKKLAQVKLEMELQKNLMVFSLIF